MKKLITGILVTILLTISTNTFADNTITAIDKDSKSYTIDVPFTAIDKDSTKYTIAHSFSTISKNSNNTENIIKTEMEIKQITHGYTYNYYSYSFFALKEGEFGRHFMIFTDKKDEHVLQALQDVLIGQTITVTIDTKGTNNIYKYEFLDYELNIEAVESNTKYNIPSYAYSFLERNNPKLIGLFESSGNKTGFKPSEYEIKKLKAEINKKYSGLIDFNIVVEGNKVNILPVNSTFTRQEYSDLKIFLAKKYWIDEFGLSYKYYGYDQNKFGIFGLGIW